MSFLSQALNLAEQGFYVFPLRPGSKLPLIEDFPNQATRDPEKIKRFWLDPVLDIEQPYNIGISTTKYNGNQALVVVDIDDKGKKKGSDEVLKLELQGYDFIETVSTKTPSGGRHLIYRAKVAVKQGTSVLANGIDIRSKGGYIAAPGSVIDGVAYAFDNDLPVAECPEWIIAQCGKALEKVVRDSPKEFNQERAILRAKEYLETAPVSTEGEGGDQTAYKVAATIKDFGVDQLMAVNLMLDHWNDKCDPPWSAKEIQTKVANAYSYGVNPKGERAPEKDFKPVKEISESNFLQKLNENYAIIFQGTYHSVVFESTGSTGEFSRDFLSEQSFKRKFSPYLVQQGKSKAKSYAEVWLDWEGRRQYDGVCFMPEQKAPENYYNLWRGFKHKATPYNEASQVARESFDMFIRHAKENVAHGNEKLFNWLMGYFAHMIQRPFEKPLTTVVFRGRKGVGKNALVDRVGNLLSAGSFLVAHDGRYLTSNFNGHLDSCLCLVLDEAFWSGDKQAEGKLKGITTSPTILIERKGQESYNVQNLVRIIVIGNEEWLVPASSDERRYAVYDVGEGNKQDRDFFHKMRVGIDEQGGAEVLMHYLKNFDLSKVDVNDAPVTQALIDQKHESMSALEQFWFQCLSENGLAHGSFDSDWTNPETKIPKAEFRRAFKSYCAERGIRTWLPTEQVIGRELSRFSPSITTTKVSMSTDGSNTKQSAAYVIAGIDTLKKEWDARMGFDKVLD
jgi:hypothetical protein